MTQEFKVNRAGLAFCAVFGVVFLLLGAGVLWLMANYLIPANWELPFFDGDKESWVFVILMVLLAALPIGISVWIFAIVRRHWNVRIQLGEEGLVSYNNAGAKNILWKDIQEIQEKQLFVEPATPGGVKLIAQPFNSQICHRICTLKLKDGAELEISDMHSQNLLVSLLTVQAEKHQIPWQTSSEKI